MDNRHMEYVDGASDCESCGPGCTSLGESPVSEIPFQLLSPSDAFSTPDTRLILDLGHAADRGDETSWRMLSDILDYRQFRVSDRVLAYHNAHVALQAYGCHAARHDLESPDQLRGIVNHYAWVGDDPLLVPWICERYQRVRDRWDLVENYLQHGETGTLADLKRMSAYTLAQIDGADPTAQQAALSARAAQLHPQARVAFAMVADSFHGVRVGEEQAGLTGLTSSLVGLGDDVPVAALSAVERGAIDAAASCGGGSAAHAQATRIHRLDSLMDAMPVAQRRDAEVYAAERYGYPTTQARLREATIIFWKTGMEPSEYYQHKGWCGHDLPVQECPVHCGHPMHSRVILPEIGL